MALVRDAQVTAVRMGLELPFHDRSMIKGEWTPSRTLITERTVISSGVVSLRKTVSENGLVGAGAVTRDVPGFAVAVGNQAGIVGDVRGQRTRNIVNGEGHVR